jgi:hypothetical protein
MTDTSSAAVVVGVDGSAENVHCAGPPTTRA